MAGPRMKGSHQNRTNIIKVHSVSLEDKLPKKYQIEKINMKIIFCATLCSMCNTSPSGSVSKATPDPRERSARGDLCCAVMDVSWSDQLSALT